MPGGWWHDSETTGRIICDLCPRECNLGDGDRGFCFVRENRDGRMLLTTYGRITGFCIDPIEKQPLNLIFPGTSVLPRSRFRQGAGRAPLSSVSGGS